MSLVVKMAMLGKCLCMFLCSIGAVLAADDCSSFGQVNALHRQCRNTTITSSDYYTSEKMMTKLRLECSSEVSYRACMYGMVAECAEKEKVQEEIDNMFSLCNGSNGIANWSEEYLQAYDTLDLRCSEAVAWASCFEDVMTLAKGFSYTKKSLESGLEALKKLKHAYFACYKTGLQEVLPTIVFCPDQQWRRTYASIIVLRTVGPRLFGMHIDEHDKQEIENMQMPL